MRRHPAGGETEDRGNVANLDHGYLTNPGLVRGTNEDYLGYYPTAWATLVVVADGMGGMGGGSVASQLTVNAIRDLFLLRQGDDPREVLRDAGRMADTVVLKRAREEQALEKMGATVAVAIIQNDRAYYAHAGDARIYLIRPDEARQLTRDHTTVQRLVDDGLIAAADAAAHPMAHVVQRAIGHMRDDEIEVAAEPIQLREGDALLLCSDGLTDLVDDHEIAEIVRANDPQPACDKLLNAVLKRGAHDNTTIQIVRYGTKTAEPQTRDAVKIEEARGRLSFPDERRESRAASGSRRGGWSWAWTIRLILLALILLTILLFAIFRPWAFDVLIPKSLIHAGQSAVFVLAAMRAELFDGAKSDMADAMPKANLL